MPSELPGGFQNKKIYLLKGSTINMLIKAIQSRTPLPQDPLTAEDDDAGVKIIAPHFPMVVCLDDGGGGYVEKRADVMGSPADE